MIRLSYSALSILISIMMLFLSGCATEPPPPVAKRGVFDLSGWDFHTRGSLPLNGQWEFYEGHLLGPDDFLSKHTPSPTGFFSLSDHWPESSARGYFTCRLKARLKPGHTGLAIRVGEFFSAYNLWVNGRLEATVGNVGTTRETEDPATAIRYIRIDNSCESLDLVLQISNFHKTNKGVADAILMGNEPALRKKDRNRFSYLLMVSGALLIMGLYHFLIYLIRSDERATLYLSLLCLLAGIHHSCDWFLLDMSPQMAKLALYRIDRISFYLSVLMIILYMNAFFSEEASPISYPVYITAATGSSLIVLFSPDSVYTHLELPYQFVAFSGILYLIWVIIKAIRNKREGSLLLLLGFGLLGLTGINDILYVNSLIQTGYLYSAGVLILVLSQALVLSMRFFRAFQTVENLSVALEEKNIELSRMDKIKDEFLAVTSHELRTPIHGMVGLSEALQEKGACDEKELSHHLGLISASGRRLAGLVGELLDFSRLKHSDEAIELESVKLDSVVNHVMSVCQPTWQGTGLSVEAVGDFSNLHVLADGLRLQQILINLLDNAVKYTSRGRVELNITDDANSVTLAVKDSGDGMSSEDLNTIFDAFSRGGRAMTSGEGGLGLGLSIASKLLTLHGSALDVDSVPGEGSTFSFQLKKSQPGPSIGVEAWTPQAKQLPMPTLVEPAPAERTGLRSVLVVDDDPINLQVVASQLKVMDDLAIALVACGRQALEWVKANGPPDLILLDVMMPDMSGYEVCRTLRKEHSVHELPILFLTARTRAEDLVFGFDAGGNDYLVKPFERRELLARVKAQLNAKMTFETLKENLLLKKRLSHEQRAALELKRVHARLSRILDAVGESVVAVNQGRCITFCNERCEALLGHGAADLLGTSAETLVAETFRPRAREVLEEMCAADMDALPSATKGSLPLLHKTRGEIPCHAHAVPLRVEEELFLVVIVHEMKASSRKKSPLDQGATMLLISELNRNRERVNHLEEMLDSPELISDHQVRKGLNTIDATLAQMKNVLLEPASDLEKKRLGVRAMTLAVEYWHLATGENRIALAETSKLWKVHTNQNGFQRTQTLDKYLDIKLIPKQPRWNQIHQTVEFVLTACQDPSPLRDELERTFAELRMTK